MATKYIFVTSDEVSSSDKGIMVASLARLLQFRGYVVTVQKFDSCLNVDWSATHGECFVTVDGHEVDSELGCYERFADIETTHNNHITMGHIYRNVMDKECRGDYAGEIVKMIPHVTDEIIRRIKVHECTGKYDFVITEIGGNVGNIDTLPYVETIRLLKKELKQDCVCVHIVNTSEDVLSDDKNIADVVLSLQKDCSGGKIKELKFEEDVLNELGIIYGDRCRSAEWENFEKRRDDATDVLKIGVVGKYADSSSAYEAINASVVITAAYNDIKPEIRYICSEIFNAGNVDELLNGVDGVIIASDINTCSIEGKLVALKWCREHDIPTLGIGQGMQSMIIEFARNVAGLKEANSTEADGKTPYNVIDVMAEQKRLSIVGGVMRLGTYRCDFVGDSIAMKAYGKPTVQERHRHRYELNNDYREQLETAGMKCTGINPETNLVDVVELPRNTWYVGTQYHPEFNCTVLHPNLLIMDFMRAVKEKKNNKLIIKEK